MAREIPPGTEIEWPQGRGKFVRRSHRDRSIAIIQNNSGRLVVVRYNQIAAIRFPDTERRK